MSTVYTALNVAHPGQTSLTINLAILYARSHPDEKVLLIDFNFRKPDIALFFGLVDYFHDIYPRSMEDLYPLITGRQSILLEQYLSCPIKELSNFYVMPGFILHTNCDKDLSPNHMAYFFSFLNDFADFMIFDTDSNYRHPAFSYLIGETDIFILGITEDPFASAHAKPMIEYFNSMGRHQDIRPILMRCEVDSPFKLEYFSKILGLPVHTKLPNISRKRYLSQIYDIKPIALFDKEPFTVHLLTFLQTVSSIESLPVKRRRFPEWIMKLIQQLKLKLQPIYPTIQSETESLPKR